MTDIFFLKRAGRHFGFFKRAGRHEKGAGRRALQKKPRQNTGSKMLHADNNRSDGACSWHTLGEFAFMIKSIKNCLNLRLNHVDLLTFKIYQ